MRRMKGVGIGAGYFSQFHYEAWGRIQEVEMAAVCDRDLAKAREKAEQFGIARWDDDWRAAIERERPDFIDIITPPPSHEEICRFAAERGIHIICQKPLAPTLEEGRRIVANARERGVRFMVHENWRWQPWYREIKRIQNAGTIGEFTHVHFLMRMGDGWGERAYLDRQPFFREYPRLLVYETGVHFLDTFRFLLGEVREVYAQLRRLNPVIRGEETGQVFLRFESGATAIWDANRYNETEAASPRYTFGEMRVDGMGGHLTLDSEAHLRVKRLGQPGLDLAYAHENRQFAGDCVHSLQRHFVESMAAGTEFETSGEEYLKTLEVVEAVYESAARGEVVRLQGKGPAR